MTPEDAIIRIALPSKGHLYDGSLALFRDAGYSIRRPSDRQYEATIAGHSRFHVVFMRPADIVAQVREGRCQLGITGMDVYAEHRGDDEATHAIVDDLGYGGCRLAIAVPESWIDVGHILDLVDLTTEFKAAGKTFRVSTKYPHLVRAYFRKWGIYYYQVIASDGALELHPSLGIADIIVDLTSSGATLKDNRLKLIEEGTVLDSAACLIGHVRSLQRLVAEPEGAAFGLLCDALDAVRGAAEWLHLEVMGESRDEQSLDYVMNFLRDRGVRHPARESLGGTVSGHTWRVTGLIRPRDFVACRRLVSEFGALRVTATPLKLFFGAGEHSTFESLRSALDATLPGSDAAENA
jgi:ATP phosphoribosyltransferase